MSERVRGKERLILFFFFIHSFFFFSFFFDHTERARKSAKRTKNTKE